MADMNKLLGQLLGSGAAGGFAGGLAYAAYQRYSTGKDTADSALSQTAEAELVPAPEGSAFMPAKNNPAEQEALGLTLVRAMIAAERADGGLDAKEIHLCLFAL